MNLHNCHYWAGEDPCIASEIIQNRPKVKVWCGMTLDRIVGPFILRNTVNAERYAIMMREEIWPVISTLGSIEDLIIMQDGAPKQFAIVVRECRNDHFPGRWMGHLGTHKWPARSPDLTSFDFFLRDG